MIDLANVIGQRIDAIIEIFELRVERVDLGRLGINKYSIPCHAGLIGADLAVQRGDRGRIVGRAFFKRDKALTIAFNARIQQGNVGGVDRNRGLVAVNAGQIGVDRRAVR